MSRFQFLEVLTEEREDLAPAVHRLLGPVDGPVPVEEAVAGAVVTVELVDLAMLFQLYLVLVHLIGRRRPVLIAEYAEQRAGEVPGHVDRRHRRLRIELLPAHHHTAAPKVGAGVHVLPLRGVDESVPSAGAGTEDADLAVEAGLRAHPLHRGRGVADHLGIGDAALGTNLGRNIVGIRIGAARALIKVMADRDVAVMGEAARRLDVELAPAGHVVDQHDPREGAGTGRPRHIGGDRGSAVAGDRHVLAGHVSVERHRLLLRERASGS